ncbi:MAG: diguanylate cyclase [Ruminococcaceae bacterium]|nr:diguanylate cyclase [Oscillospiraceae bacterium]
MKKVLLLCNKGDLDLRAVEAAFASTGPVVTASSVGDAIGLLEQDADFVAALIDAPSRREGVGELIGYVNHKNSDIFAMPILLLSDQSTVDADLAYLGGAVIDCVGKPVYPAILRNRVERGVQLVNSVSFGEFAQMLKVLPACIYLKDIQGRYVFSSQTWHHLDTGGDPNWTIRGKTDIDIRRDRENAVLAMETDKKLIRSGKGTSYIIEENQDGIQEFLQIIKEPIRYPDGRVRGIIALINNVTDQELLRRELKRVSITDKLTGLFNRVYYEEYAKEVVDQASYPLSILTLDCDGLKKINDTYGHPAGDNYILMTVDLMRACLPERSVLFRTGGDEFVAFLPRTPAAEAAELVEKLQAAAPGFVLGGNPLGVSVGYSTLGSSSDHIDEFIKRSDDAMYRDKQRRKAARAT